MGKVGFQHSTEWGRWFVQCAQHSRSQAQENRKELPYSSSSLLQQEAPKLYSQRLPPDPGGVFSPFWPLPSLGLGLGFQDVFHVVLLASLALRPEPQASTFFVGCPSNSSKFHRRGPTRHCRKHRNDFVVPVARYHLYFQPQRAPGPLLMFGISPAVVYWQTFVTPRIMLARHSSV